MGRRRLIRILLNTATLTCLALCAGSAMLIFHLKAAGNPLALLTMGRLKIIGQWDEVWWKTAGGREGPHVSLGAAAAVFALLCGIYVRLKRMSHARPGRCPACGYDLRATPDRCPECGAVTPRPPPPSA